MIEISGDINMSGSDACMILVIFASVAIILSLITCIIIAWIYGTKAARIARDITASKLDQERYSDAYRDKIIRDVVDVLNDQRK